MDDLIKKIQAANNMVITDEVEAQEEAPVVPPVDIYQERQRVQRDYAKKSFPRGARSQVLATVADVINGAGTQSLAHAYERAKDDSEALRSMGDKRRAQLVVNQYMQESFLPAVEVVVNFTSPDELLNSKEGLKELDKYALGAGSMSGYTAAYIREAYGNVLGQTEPASSPEVEDAMLRIDGFLDSDQMVLARGLAYKIKKKIDDGKVIASPEVYQKLLTVASNRSKR